MSLEIKRLIDRQIHTITLTEEELEQAYRIKERHYLEEDFANVLADTAQNPDTRFHSSGGISGTHGLALRMLRPFL